jgi:hypothetical protein
VRHGHDDYHNHNDPRVPATVERLEVSVVRFVRGVGCCEESPVRLVTAYYAEDGVLLFEKDEADA